VLPRAGRPARHRLPEQVQSAQLVFRERLRQSREAKQPDEVVLASHRRHPDRVKVCRLHRSNVAEAKGNPASDLQNPVR
jgi:hypothetical protein